MLGAGPAESFAVVEETTNNQYRFEMPGAQLQSHEWESCMEAILRESHGADFLVASGSLPSGVPDDFYAQLAQKNRDTSLKLVIDTAGEPLKKLKGSGLFLPKTMREQ